MRIALIVLGLVALNLTGCSQPPCKTFCEIHCEHGIECSDGNPPQGAVHDACIQSCVDAVLSEGITEDEQCNCGGDAGVSCQNTAIGRWADDYSC